MNIIQGFSLTEVLVALILITTTSLSLLKQEWRVSQLISQADLRMKALVQLDNASERMLLGLHASAVDAPFKLKTSSCKNKITMNITWIAPNSQKNTQESLNRTVVVR